MLWGRAAPYLMKGGCLVHSTVPFNTLNLRMLDFTQLQTFYFTPADTFL